MGLPGLVPALPSRPSSPTDTAVPLKAGPEWEGLSASPSPLQNAFQAAAAGGGREGLLRKVGRLQDMLYPSQAPLPSLSQSQAVDVGPRGAEKS